MKISTKGRYALTFMLDLLIHEDGKPVSLSDVSQRQEISDKYLEQIAGILTRSGLIQGIRGSSGGYMLSRNANEYTVGEILRVMEGELALAPCAEKNGVCKRKDKCSNIFLWQKIDDAINAVIDNVTLADMYEWQKEKVSAEHNCV